MGAKDALENAVIDLDIGKRKDRTQYPVIAIRELILNSR